MHIFLYFQDLVLYENILPFYNLIIKGHKNGNCTLIESKKISLQMVEIRK